MSIYSIVTAQGLIILRKLAEQQKNQRVFEIKNRILRQIHNVKRAESQSPITKNLEEVNQSTKKIEEINEETNSENETNHEIVPLKLIQIIQRVIKLILM